VPSQSYLSEKHGVTERTIRRDLRDLAESIPEETVSEIRALLFLRIKDRIPEMGDNHLLELAEFFLSKKQSVDIQGASEYRIIVENLFKGEDPDGGSKVETA
jgi:transcriptional antiterminator